MNTIPYAIDATITIVSFIFYLFIVYVYFHKNPRYSIRNRIFKKYLGFGIFAFLFEGLYLLLIKFSTNKLLIGLSRKFLLLCFVACAILWIFYVFILIYEKHKEGANFIRRNYHNIEFYILLSIVTITIIDIFLPIGFVKGENDLYSYLTGAGLVFNSILVIVLFLVPIPFIFAKRDIVSWKRLRPYFINFVLVFGMMFLLNKFPTYLIEMLVFTMSTYLIYYRLENPDIIFVRNSKKNVDRMRLLREKYGFLFNMSPELRDLLNEISFMKENYLMDGARVASKRKQKLETLINDFIKSSEFGVTQQTNMDEDGVEILDLEEEVPDEMLVTKEIYSLDELKEVLKEDNLPKW